MRPMPKPEQQLPMGQYAMMDPQWNGPQASVDFFRQQEQLRAQIHQGKQHQEHGDPLG